MKITIQKAKKMFTKILATSGVSKKDVSTIVEMLLEQDLYGNKFSAFTISEIDGVLNQLKNSVGVKQTIMVNKPSMKLINGNGKSAWLIGQEMVKMVCDMAKKQGIGAVGLYNTTYHNIMAYYSRKIAEQKLLAIILANGGPASVAPFGGSQPLFGTNPLSFGIPTKGTPIIFDGATGQFAYGTIRIAKRLGKKLFPDTYFAKDGTFTTDPEKAIGLIPFGGYKGYAVNLLIEVLTGALVRAKMGFATKSEKDLGSFFIAVDPSCFVPYKTFTDETSRLVKEILSNKPLPGMKVRVPGQGSEKIKERIMKSGFFDVNEEVWKQFNDFYNKTVI